MTQTHIPILSIFHPRRVAIPIVIGLGVAAYTLAANFDMSRFSSIEWTINSVICIIIAIMLMGIRDFAYMYRIRLLTDKQLTWRKAFDVIMLWEFASAVTPSIVGGSAVAVFIVNKEGVKFGRSTAIVLVTAMLDELFYIIMVPLVMIIVGFDRVFVEHQFAILGLTKLGTLPLFTLFIIGYFFIVFLTSFIAYGIFVNPKGFKYLLQKFFSIKILRKWQSSAEQTGDDIITTSLEMKGRSFVFWLKAFGATLFSWTARFFVVNFVIMSVMGFNSFDTNMMIYVRQLIMWVILLISPTPGGSGIAEFFFPVFFNGFITEGIAPGLGLLWRFISYYPYLFIGAIVLPNWLKRVIYNKPSTN